MRDALLCKSLAGATVLSLLLGACGPREVTWERAGIRYTKRVDDPSVDADVVEELIRHRDVLAAYLGLQPPRGSTLRYRKFLDRDDIGKRGHCSAVSAGCFFDQFGVESKQPLDVHELIHAYTAYLGPKPKIVEEGLAQALSCEQPTVGSVDLAAEVAWSKHAWQSPFLRDIDALYRAGAAFVAFVLRTRGAERFMEFYSRLGSEDELPAAATKFAEVFGEPLVGVWVDALANRGADRACVYPTRCALPPLTPEFSVFESDGETVLQMTSNEPGDRDWRVGACGTTALEDADVDRTGDGAVKAHVASLALGRGRYWYSREAVAVTKRPLAEVFGSDQHCSTLEPLEAGEQLFGISAQTMATLREADQRAPVNGSWILRAKLDVPEGGVLVECSPSVRVEICESCAYTNCRTACETGRPAEAFGNGVVSRGDAVLRVHLQKDSGFWVRWRAHTRADQHL